jgi:hypothetical protein
MFGRQLDLFSAAGIPVSDDATAAPNPPHLAPGNLDDATLAASLSTAHLADCRALCAEVCRRKLTTAIPALEALCRRFKGFGLEHAVPEQIAALSALAAINTPEAAAAVSRIIADSVVQGPGLHDAVDAALHLGCRLPPAISVALLRHNTAQLRAAACRCARPHPDVIPLLIDLLDDLQEPVAVAAACALGRIGRIEARPMLARLLRDKPTEEVIDAVSSVADEDCIVRLGRIARIDPTLSIAAIAALDLIEHPRAQAVIAAVRGTD